MLRTFSAIPTVKYVVRYTDGETGLICYVSFEYLNDAKEFISIQTRKSLYAELFVKQEGL